MLAGHVERLPLHHAEGVVGQEPRHACAARGVVRRQQVREGERLQPVAHQHRRRLAVDLVDGRPAAPQVVVVHARQVVVDQRVGVDQLQGDREADRQRAVGGVAAAGLAAGQHQRRAQPLAAAHQRVAHGPPELRRAEGSTRGQQHAQPGLDPAGHGAQVLVDGEGSGQGGHL